MKLNNKKILVFIFILVLGYCKSEDLKHIPKKETIIKDVCPRNNYEFYQNFIFYEYDVIKQKDQLRVEHYPTSNERRIDLFYPYIKNKKGGYIGVGTDQNLTFIAWAKSDYAYLVDFDWVAVYINRLHLLFIDKSENFQQFREKWSLKNKKNTIQFIKNYFKDKEEQKKFLKAYSIALYPVQERFRDLEYMSKHFKFSSFHNNPEDFQYLKKMIQENKIYPIVGDINGTITLQNIGKASKKLCVPIHVIYLSNAEEYYRYPESFRKNIMSLNIDKDAIIIRTVTTGAKIFGYPEGEKYLEIPFHYNIQKVENLIQWFQLEKLWIYHMLKYRRDIEKGFSILETTPLEAGLLQTSIQN
ncbi:MAG: hypothetical protein KatS3mg129_0008 [Leptospiraceae bacterium]|nr:MAG: hypothetical protein KatS3mg129_0008 [Leptospiraceae bacterium]